MQNELLLAPIQGSQYSYSTIILRHHGTVKPTSLFFSALMPLLSTTSAYNTLSTVASTAPRKLSRSSPQTTHIRHVTSSHMHNRRRDAVLARHRAAADQSLPDPPAAPPPTDRQQDDPNTAQTRRADRWILQYHDAWSRLTLSSFYQDLEEGSLTPQQYGRWLLDRASVSIAILEAATRAADILRLSTSHSVLPLLLIAKEDATFLAEFAVLNGFDISSEYRLSHAGKRLVDLIEASTAPDAPPVVVLTAVWSYMFGSWQAWALCLRRKRPIPPHFETIANFISRGNALSQLFLSQEILDQLLSSSSSQQEFEKAGKTFEEIVRRSCAVLDHTMYVGDGNEVPLCTCGRKGHFPSQCTFKSHI